MVADPFGPEGRWLFEVEFEGHRHEFAVADAYLRAHSTWRADRDPLPISRATAIQAATEEAHRLMPEVGNWGLEDLTLRWVFDECWYFEVTLSDGDRPVAGRIPQDRMIKIPVLLNGVAVQPYRSR